MKLWLPGDRTVVTTSSGKIYGKRAREDTVTDDERPVKSRRLDKDEIDALFEDEEEADNQTNDHLLSTDDIGEVNNLANTSSLPAAAPQASEHQVSEKEPVFDEEIGRLPKDFNKTPDIFQPNATTSDYNQGLESSLDEFLNVEGFDSSFTNGYAHAPAATSGVSLAAYPIGLALSPWQHMDAPMAVPQLVYSSSSDVTPPSSTAIPTPVSDPSAHLISTKKPGPGRRRTNPKRNENEPKRQRGRPRKDAAPKPIRALVPRSDPVKHTALGFNSQAHQAPNPASGIQFPLETPTMQAHLLQEGHLSNEGLNNEGTRLTFCLVNHGHRMVQINKTELCKHSALIRHACRIKGKIYWPPNTIQEPQHEDNLLSAELLYNEPANRRPMTILCTPAVWEALAKMIHENGNGRLGVSDVNNFIVNRGNPAFHLLFVAQVYKLMKCLQMNGLADKVFLNSIEPAWETYKAQYLPASDDEIYGLVETHYLKALMEYWDMGTFPSYGQMNIGLNIGNVEGVTKTGPIH